MKLIGLMSGTSADGVDAALVEIEGKPPDLSWELLGFVELPYPKPVRQSILDLCDVKTAQVDAICAMNVALGEWFADAALAVCTKVGIAADEVDAIGSHGQTIHHLPDVTFIADKAVRSTLQIGAPATIAERTGITTVSDFRLRDMAVGGQGAPLVPLVDYMLYASSDVGRVLLNIGGIANVTVLPKACGLEDVFAFDTGPGNMVIDGIVQRVTQGTMVFDKEGALAQQGMVLSELLDACMANPFFAKAPPKSTGREMFGVSVVNQFCEYADSAEDLIATATHWTAHSIAKAIDDFVLPQCDVGEVIVSGGGAKNPVIMRLLQEMLGPTLLQSDDFGLPSEAKEAVAFALLAYESLHGRCNNVPKVTGATKPVVLGSVTLGARGWPV